MTIHVRRLTDEDHTQWLPLWQGYLTFYEAEVDDAVTQITWQRLVSVDEQPHGLCAVDETGRLMGIVHYLFHPVTWSISDRCYLEDLFVDPTVRGGGVGKKLIEAVYAAADAQGADQTYWLTQEFNDRARRLYDHVATVTPFIKYKR